MIRHFVPHPSGRCCATLLAFARRTLSKVLVLPRMGNSFFTGMFIRKCVLSERMVVGEGFEPSKSVTADLQSAPFGRSGTPPGYLIWCRLPESNWRPTDYKSVALPTELSRHQVQRILGRHPHLCNKKFVFRALMLSFYANHSFCAQTE